MRDFVAFYAGYRTRYSVPEVHRGLPSPFLTLIFTLDEPLHLVRRVDPAQPARSYDSLIGGLHTTPVLIAHDGAQSGIQVHLHPLGARMLLGCPAAEIAGLDLDADDLLGSVVDRVRERFVLARTWPQRFAVIESALSAQLNSPPRDVPAEVRYAWRRLTAGHVSVAAVVGETGWSDRHLTKQMRAETGMSPKQIARLARFDRARRQLQRLGGGDIAGIAVDNGYFDEAHMSREFSAFAGEPPLRWLRAEFGGHSAGSAPAFGGHSAGSAPVFGNVQSPEEHSARRSVS